MLLDVVSLPAGCMLQATTTVTHAPFSGDPHVDLWVLSDTTGSGVSVSISTLGAAIQSLKVYSSSSPRSSFVLLTYHAQCLKGEP